MKVTSLSWEGLLVIDVLWPLVTLAWVSGTQRPKAPDRMFGGLYAT